MPPKQRKIAIMGYRSVGKSSLSIQFVDNIFVDSYDPTIENSTYSNLKDSFFHNWIVKMYKTELTITFETVIASSATAIRRLLLMCPIVVP